ncbi:MAG: glutamine synthetase family protein [Elusimicrobia bacterium]|nr:glutamine synthetase family protein [Elusimicrobiota bacterium]
MKIQANRVAKYLNKEPRYFTKRDIIKFIEGNSIRMVNFRYVGGDGKLKILNFSISDAKYLNRMLSAGERVDGSSLFKNIGASSSDLYVIPKYKTAFVNPFSEIPALELLCSFYTPEGKPFDSSSENILGKAENIFKQITGYEFHALGELEYYVIAPNNPLYPMNAQKGYHESYPFAKWEALRCEAMDAISGAGGKLKYGHSEVGFIRTQDDEMSQQEIEFLPVNAVDAADQLTIAKWMLSAIGYKYGVTLSFAPKISVGHAGSGLHIHTCLIKNGKNAMIKKGDLSIDAKKTINGYMALAKSLTAFGNTVPTSYLRLVPHQEAPTKICWGFRDRSALVRVPISWFNAGNMIGSLNPGINNVNFKVDHGQTVEFRSADGSANIHLFLAGLCVAARHGFEMKNGIEMFGKFFAAQNASLNSKKINSKFDNLPSSCHESADSLKEDRKIYEKYGVFSGSVIDSTIKRLKNYDDKNLNERLYGKEEEIKKLVDEYLYC